MTFLVFVGEIVLGLNFDLRLTRVVSSPGASLGYLPVVVWTDPWHLPGIACRNLLVYFVSIVAAVSNFMTCCI